MTLMIKNSPMNNYEFDSLEDKLGKLLSPRQANPEFVQKLKYRLTYEPGIKLESRKKFKALWILAIALFSGGFLLFIISLMNGNKVKTSD
jgi:hypothetical protein